MERTGHEHRPIVIYPAGPPFTTTLCGIGARSLPLAFNDLELQHIDNTVGVMCRHRSPPQFKDQLQIIYEVNGHSVLVYETRPPWDKPGEWTKLGVAKFTSVRSRKEWKLYWMRRDLKWHAYDPETGTKRNSLERLVQVVDTDRYGAFFG